MPSPILTALNFVGSRFGFEKIYHDSGVYETDSQLTSRKAAKLSASALPKLDGFDTYIKKRHADIKALFKDVKYKPDQEGPFQSKINELLTLSPEIIAAKKTYDGSIKDITTYLNSKKAHHVKDVVSYLFEERSRALAAINNQHAMDIDTFNRLFLQEDVNTMIDQPNPDLISSELKSLEESQKATTAAFENSITEPLTKLLDTHDRKFATLERYNENDNPTKAELEKLLSVTAQGRGPRALNDITDKELKTLKTIKTRTGLPLTKQGENSFSVQFPDEKFGTWSHYASSENHMKRDLRSIPEAIQRLGFTEITMSLSHPNQAQAIKLARLAYETCREAGFKADSITIKVKDQDKGTYKVMTIQELFANTPHALKTIESNADRYQEQWLKLSKNPTAGFKEAMQEIRTAREGTEARSSIEQSR